MTCDKEVEKTYLLVSFVTFAAA